MKFTNTIYNQLRQYVSDNHGVRDTFFETELGKQYKTTQKAIAEFSGKRVKMIYRQSSGFMSGGGVKKGRIVAENGRIKFFEGRMRTKYLNVESGLFEGFFATVIPLEIELI